MGALKLMPATPEARIDRAYRKVALVECVLDLATRDHPDTVTFSEDMVSELIDQCQEALTALAPLLVEAESHR